jgi:uncharacterized repeat protein (TIGR01451 family)
MSGKVGTVDLLRQYQILFTRTLLLLISVLLFSTSAHSFEAEDSKIFISGFTAFQNRDYQTTIDRMSLFLKKYPDSTLRDMTLFWLAQANFKMGRKEEAARYMAQYLRENPDSNLKNAVEDELLKLAGGYVKGDVPPVVAGKAAGEVKDGKKDVIAKSYDSVPKDRVPEASGAALKEQAIAGYKSVIKDYPGSSAAAKAEERLQALAEPQQQPAKKPAAVVAAVKPGRKTQVLNLEVAQSAAVECTLLPYELTHEAGSKVLVPFEVLNNGNGADSFNLEAGFPPEFGARFAAAESPDVSLRVTPTLAPGAKFRGIVAVTIPPTNVDGQKSSFPIKLASNHDSGVSRSREISLVASAPLLRAVVNPDKELVAPGDTVTYRVTLLNIGSAAARRASFTLTFPPQYEPVEYSGFSKDAKSMLVSGEMRIGSGETREFPVKFRLKDGALAGQELFCRVELVAKDFQSSVSFVSRVAMVDRISGVAMRTNSDTLVVLPGQRVLIPITVINTGNVRERFALKASIPTAMNYKFNRIAGSTGPLQSVEPLSGSIGPLSPREEAAMVLELVTPTEVADGADASLNVTLEPEGNPNKSAALPLRLVFSRPVVELVVAAKNGSLKPGEVTHLELNCFNRGSNVAMDVAVQSFLPGQVETVATDPPSRVGKDGELIWQIAELGSGEKRSLVLTYKVKANIPAGTGLRIENIFSYKDQLGNSY